MDLMIFACPESCFQLMVTEETPEVDARQVDSVIAFADELNKATAILMGKYDIKTISIYGKQSYIDHIADKLESSLTSYSCKEVNRLYS